MGRNATTGRWLRRGNGTDTYAWNARNQLAAVKQGSTTIASFSYDPLGRRVGTNFNGNAASYLYDGLNAVQETHGSTATSILTGLAVDERFARTDLGGRTDFLSDALNSTMALTNSAGAIVEQYSYDPYGATTASMSGFDNPYQYTGRENDGDGLYYYRARYYAPAMGRFISEDPLGFGGGGENLYAYVGDNPISLVDPFGLCPSQKCQGAGNAPSPQQYVNDAQALANQSPSVLNGLDEIAILLQFHRGGALNAQAYGASNNYANYVYGAFFAGLGWPLQVTLGVANVYGTLFSHYNPNEVQMSSSYPGIPAVNVQNIVNGYNATKAGVLCIKAQ